SPGDPSVVTPAPGTSGDDSGSTIVVPPATTVATAPAATAADGSTASGTVGAAALGSGGALAAGPPPEAPAIVRLRDVARIELGAQNYNTISTFDGQPSVGLGLYQLPGTNALEVGDNVKAKMQELKSSFPDGIEYEIAYDTTPYVRDSIRDVVRTLLES